MQKKRIVRTLDECGCVNTHVDNGVFLDGRLKTLQKCGLRGKHEGQSPARGRKTRTKKTKTDPKERRHVSSIISCTEWLERD